MISVLEADKAEKRRESLVSKPFAHYILITIKSALQTRSTHYTLIPQHFQSRLNKDKNSSCPPEGEAGMKIREYDRQACISKWLFHPFICMYQITSLLRKLRAATCLCLLSLWEHDWWATVAQSCPTLCDPMDCSPPGSSVHGIIQARILEWVAISFLRAYFCLNKFLLFFLNLPVSEFFLWQDKNFSFTGNIDTVD